MKTKCLKPPEFPPDREEWYPGFLGLRFSKWLRKQEIKPKFNYHYTIRYKPLYFFDFIKYNDLVDEVCYKYRVFNYLKKITNILTKDPNSRQAVIMTHNNVNNACLISLQFQIVKKKLIVTANFRSQCKINGKPHDVQMLRYFATIVMLLLDLKRFKIYVNTGNYHHNTSIDQGIPPTNFNNLLTND